jgi:hypothetical protein
MSGNNLEKRLRFAGVLLILGLAVEALCLVWTRPLAFLVLVGVAGFLCAAGIGVYLYSLVSGAEAKSSSE